MTVRNKGVIAFIREQQPHIFLQGCPCHLVHLAAEKASRQLQMSIDDLIDLFYYMDKSSKCVLKLKECQIQCDTKAHKILKHATTRWLSLGQCIGRLLEQWPALQVFVNEEAETYMKQNSKKVRDICLSKHFLKSF